MKRSTILITILFSLGATNAFPCGGEADPESSLSCNEVFKEIAFDKDSFDYLIDNEEYREFQFFYNPYYDYPNYDERIKSGNIREWTTYLKISEKQAFHLVNKATKGNIDSLLIYGTCHDPQLNFANKEFIQKRKAALNYLSFSKYLEPYMTRGRGVAKDEKGNPYQWDEYQYWEYPYERYHWRPQDGSTVLDLDYTTIINNMIEAYEKQSDLELKIRYAYQIVRFAHYNNQNEDAVSYFEKYVEPLNHKPEIYYYALSQKAGALNGCIKQGQCESTKKTNQVALDFLNVFTHSKDLKYSAYLSLRFSGNGKALESLYKQANQLTKDQACNLYFLLGHDNFNNPLNELEKIMRLNPSSHLADILMARYLSSIYVNEYTYKDIKNTDLGQALNIVERMVGLSTHHDFWHLCAAHILTYMNNYDAAKKHLLTVKSKRPSYLVNCGLLSTYLAISESDQMTREKANEIYSSNKEEMEHIVLRKLMMSKMGDDLEVQRGLLSFGYLSGYESDRWNKIIALGNNPNANEFEKWLLSKNGYSLEQAKIELSKSYLYEGNIPMAAKEYPVNKNINDLLELKCVFCYNIGYIYQYKPEDQNDFHSDYISEFIDKKTNLENISYGDLMKILNNLYSAAQGNDKRGAKASFILGNFYFNVSPKGYYRDQIFGCDPDYLWDRENNDLNNYDFHTDRDYYLKASEKNFNDQELEAKIVFSLAKVGEEGIRKGGPHYDKLEETYKGTKAYKEFVSKCKCFKYYVND